MDSVPRKQVHGDFATLRAGIALAAHGGSIHLARSGLQLHPVESLLSLLPERPHVALQGAWGVKAFMKLRHGLRIQVQARREIGKVLLFCRRIDLNGEQ
jgi:hypothetical protein